MNSLMLGLELLEKEVDRLQEIESRLNEAIKLDKGQTYTVETLKIIRGDDG